MIVRDVLANKGTDVVTVSPGATITDLVALLAENHIGAVIASGASGAIDGIVSERDIARSLYEHGAATLTMTVADLMTTDVRTCVHDDEVEELMHVMTESRVRHIPLVEDGVLRGIISIGDVVKNRMDQLEFERDQLDTYVHQTDKQPSV